MGGGELMDVLMLILLLPGFIFGVYGIFVMGAEIWSDIRRYL